MGTRWFRSDKLDMTERITRLVTLLFGDDKLDTTAKRVRNGLKGGEIWALVGSEMINWT